MTASGHKQPRSVARKIAKIVSYDPKGVRVVSIAPTFIMTPLTEPFFDDPAFKKWVLDRIPIGRLGTVTRSRRPSSSSPRPPPR
jgi:NAD(P)-dependent dehydrogenase (short-subunit alcohol dehydrogenase family)